MFNFDELDALTNEVKAEETVVVKTKSFTVDEMAVMIEELDGQIKASENYVTDSNLSLQKNIDDLRVQWTAKEEEMKRLQDEMDAITKEIKIIATSKQEITDAGSQKIAEWREKIQALQIAKAKEEEENSAESLAMQLRIQKAMKDAIARSRKEAGIHDDPREEAGRQQALQGSGICQEQHWYQWQGPYTWPQFDSGMQPALVAKSDGRSAAGYAWEKQIREPQRDQWSSPNWAWQSPQYVNWQNNPAPNFQAPSRCPPAPPPAPPQSPKVQAPVGQKHEGTGDVAMPLPWAGEKIPTAKKTEQSESRATAESGGPMPIPGPSAKDLRSSWREQVAKRLAERQIKARRNSSKPKDAPAPAPSSTSDEEKRCQIQSSTTIKKEELDQIGQTLDTLYARRRELEEPQSPEACKIMLGRVKKSVHWADMNSGENFEGLTSPQRAHGGG